MPKQRYCKITTTKTAYVFSGIKEAEIKHLNPSLYAHPKTHTHKHTHTTRAPPHTHTHTHTHTQTHTRTHTHTHTLRLPNCIWSLPRLSLQIGRAACRRRVEL